MFLRSDLRYVVLDFETTGVDKKYDEIIQVGIIEFDNMGHKIQEFSSYVKPEHTEKLHDIIDMITGISVDTLMTAPSWYDIQSTVQSFFDDKTVIIGHSVGFDIAFLNRYGISGCCTSIDTLSLSQICKPYLQSYALEIVAQALLSGHTHTKAAYHDALVDCDITGQVFFAAVGILGHMLHSYPYLREITKRTQTGLPYCLVQPNDNRYLLQDIPHLANTILPYEQHLTANEEFAPQKRYIGDVYFDTIIEKTTTQGYISCFAQHQKVLLAQKRLAQKGMMYHIHEPQIFDMTLLHLFLTKKEMTEFERRFAIKYYVHCHNSHKSFHIVNHHEHKLVTSLLASNNRQSTKKLYTHADIFTHVSSLSCNPATHIVVYDKERLIDSYKKRRFHAIDLYIFADTLEAILYKYTLQNLDIQHIAGLLSRWYIFIGIFTNECIQFCRDVGGDSGQIDNYQGSLYFSASNKIREKLHVDIEKLATFIQPGEMVDIQVKRNQITKILSNPLHIHIKWSDYMQWIQLQPVDTFVTWDDIERLFAGYLVSYFSVLDKTLPPINFSSGITRKEIVKRKDLRVGSIPKICLIAPSKAAAQQLITSLHKSKVYKDCFLAAEHITGGAGKIIQQTLQKKSYILIGGYGFCIQSIAHGVEFDSIAALDIINQGYTNPFMDLSYYAATLQQEKSS